jgi:hypothetical protein
MRVDLELGERGRYQLYIDWVRIDAAGEEHVRCAVNKSGGTILPELLGAIIFDELHAVLYERQSIPCRR